MGFNTYSFSVHGNIHFKKQNLSNSSVYCENVPEGPATKMPDQISWHSKNSITITEPIRPILKVFSQALSLSFSRCLSLYYNILFNFYYPTTFFLISVLVCTDQPTISTATAFHVFYLILLFLNFLSRIAVYFITQVHSAQRQSSIQVTANEPPSMQLLMTSTC